MIALDELRSSWGWAFPAQIDAILDSNRFGNLLVVCQESIYRIVVEDSAVVRLCPEGQYGDLWQDAGFVKDWTCERWLASFASARGDIPDGHVISFIVPAILGGKYSPENWRTTPLSEYVQCYGDIARQISLLPDGAQVQIKVSP